MASADIDEMRARFIKLFASVPLQLRDEIIAVVDGKPVSWSNAYNQIKNKSKDGDLIIKQLVDMKVL